MNKEQQAIRVAFEDDFIWEDIAKEAVYKIDKFMPDDPHEQELFFSSNKDEKFKMIEEYIDYFIERYFEEEIEFYYVYKKEIINHIINNL